MTNIGYGWRAVILKHGAARTKTTFAVAEHLQTMHLARLAALGESLKEPPSLLLETVVAIDILAI